VYAVQVSQLRAGGGGDARDQLDAAAGGGGVR